MRVLYGFVLLCAALIQAARAEVPAAALSSDIVVLGEIHDNSAHHAVQAQWVDAIAPKALVFEMLSNADAEAVTPMVRISRQTLERALGWADSGWPAFEMYFPIFAAAPTARIYGAEVARDQLMALHGAALPDIAGDLAAPYKLAQPLPEALMAARLQLQHDAHCEAMPRDMLPMMVNVQRLRDAALADAALTAVKDTGGPVVVITGNGHARSDWGVPFVISQASDTQVFA